MKEVTAAYYAIVAEVDYWLGELLDMLNQTGLANNTMVVLTADHGEMLGSHGLMAKSNFLEEAVRVPLVISFPGRIPEGMSIATPVSALDLFATVLDYLGVSHLDQSDGKSLRRLIEPGSDGWNAQYDEGAIVSELNKRTPKNDRQMSGPLGETPELMVRYGRYKLILPRTAKSSVTDMLYDLEKDPFEERNLLSKKRLSLREISAAEHLKILLIEWMELHSKIGNYCRSNTWHNGEGRGDVLEISERRTWPSVRYWQSHYNVIRFGVPVANSSQGLSSKRVHVCR